MVWKHFLQDVYNCLPIYENDYYLPSHISRHSVTTRFSFLHSRILYIMTSLIVNLLLFSYFCLSECNDLFIVQYEKVSSELKERLESGRVSNTISRKIQTKSIESYAFCRIFRQRHFEDTRYKTETKNLQRSLRRCGVSNDFTKL